MTLYGEGAPSSTSNDVYADVLASEPPVLDFLPIVREHLSEVRKNYFIYEYI